MAGIGFDLRRMLSRDSYAGLLGAYGYAGLASTGPWVLSIGGVLAIGLLAASVVTPPEQVTQFLVAITWLMAGSLVLTGPLQLVFGRFVADRLYERRGDRILPNLLGALELAALASGGLGSLVACLAFDGSVPCRALLVANLVVLCDGWVLVVLLSGVKAHRAVAGLFLGACLASVGSALALRPLGLAGLLGGFLVGQAGALFGMLALVLRAFPGERSYLRIGAANQIREHYTISRGTQPESVTAIGDRNYIMTSGHIAHNCTIGSDTVIASCALVAGYVDIEDQAFISGGVVIHQFSKIGRLAMVGGNTRVNTDLPPFFMYVGFNAEPSGLNVVGLKRAGFTLARISELKQAYRILYRCGLKLNVALAKIEADLPGDDVRHLVEFIRRSERGICRESP